MSEDLTLIDYKKMTPLHHMCASIADKVEHSFDIIISKQVPVIIANGKLQICVFYRSEIEAKDWKGRTPFLVACEHNKPEIAKRLLSAGSGMCSSPL